MLAYGSFHGSYQLVQLSLRERTHTQPEVLSRLDIVSVEFKIHKRCITRSPCHALDFLNLIFKSLKHYNTIYFRKRNHTKMRNFTQNFGATVSASLPTVPIPIPSVRYPIWPITVFTFVLTFVIICTGLFYLLLWCMARDGMEEVYDEDLEGLIRMEGGEFDALRQMHLDQRGEWAEEVFIEHPLRGIRI